MRGGGQQDSSAGRVIGRFQWGLGQDFWFFFVGYVTSLRGLCH